MLSEVPERGANCGVYAACYFDLSGTSNELRPYIDLNSVSDDTNKVQRDFAHIIRKIVNFRKDIQSYFDSAREEHLFEGAPPGAPPEAIALAKELDNVEIKLQGFSDTVVVYLPLSYAPGRSSLIKIAPLLFSVASTMLMTFARGSIARGALDATWGTEPFDGEIYGPALLSVYELECKAGWPRVVLGPGIRAIWNTYAKASPDTYLAGLNKVRAALQSKFAFLDVDGQFAVDYLGVPMRAMIEGALSTGLIDAAQVGLETETHKHSHDSKIKNKLDRTMAYFESRVGPLTDDRRKSAAAFLRGQHPPDSLA